MFYRIIDDMIIIKPNDGETTADLNELWDIFTAYNFFADSRENYREYKRPYDSYVNVVPKWIREKPNKYDE